MSKRKRLALLGLAVMMLVCSAFTCNDDTTVDTVVEDTDGLVSEEAEVVLDVVNEVNCRLGFSTCVTETVEIE